MNANVAGQPRATTVLPNTPLMNKQCVYRRGPNQKMAEIAVLHRRTRMTRTDALVHAAWLVRAATDDDDEFFAILKRVRSQTLDERTQSRGAELTGSPEKEGSTR